MSLKKFFTGGQSMMDMTAGSPYRLIVLFSLPLLVGNVFQQLYNMVDSIVVGNWIGEKALAAVGTGFPIIFMMSSLFMGIGMGATVMISQFYGAKDFERLRNTISTIYKAMLIGAIPLTLIGVFTSEPLLRLMQVPDDGTLEMAKVYMIVVFAGMIGNLGFNINAGILQGFGDSRTSLLFLLIACIINIALDLLFTIVLGLGVMGVALATVIGQISSWLFGIWFINRRYRDLVHISLRGMRFDQTLFWQAIRLGIPSGIQQALFSIGIMFMQSLVNSYGSAFMAGFNGANKIDTFAFMPIQSFATAITTYTGQNVGAGNQHRVREGVRAGLILSVATCLAVGALLYPLSGLMMRMFSQSQPVIDAGVSYLHSVLPFYMLLAAFFIYSSVLRGAGEMIVPMIASFVSLWLARIPAAYLIAEIWGRDYIFFSYAAGWLPGVLAAGIYYYTGRWKKKSLARRAETSPDVSP